MKSVAAGRAGDDSGWNHTQLVATSCPASPASLLRHVEWRPEAADAQKDDQGGIAAHVVFVASGTARRAEATK